MKKTILVVEDEKVIRRLLITQFMESGYATLAASNGREGISIALRDHPNMIILDSVMPLMDGISMLEELRQDDWGRTAKVIILTNLTDENNESRAIKQNVSDYLIKADLNLKEIVEKIKLAIES